MVFALWRKDSRRCAELSRLLSFQKPLDFQRALRHASESDPAPPTHTSYADTIRAQRFSLEKWDRETVRVRFRSGKAAYTASPSAARGRPAGAHRTLPRPLPTLFLPHGGLGGRPGRSGARRQVLVERRAAPSAQLSGGSPAARPLARSSARRPRPGVEWRSCRPSATALPLSPGPGPPAPPFVLTAPRTPRSAGAPGPAPPGMRSAAASTRVVSRLRSRPPRPPPPRAPPRRRRNGRSTEGHSPLLTRALPGPPQRLGARHAAPPFARWTLLSLSLSFPAPRTALFGALSRPGRVAGLTAGGAARYGRAERCGCRCPFVRSGADSCGRRCPGPCGASPQHPPARRRQRLMPPTRSSPPSLLPRSAIGGGRSSGRRPGNSSAAAARGAPTGSESPSRGRARGGAGVERAIRRGACGRRPRRDDEAEVGSTEEGKGVRGVGMEGLGVGPGRKAGGAGPALRGAGWASVWRPPLRPAPLKAAGASRCLGPGVAEGARRCRQRPEGGSGTAGR